ncbi:hypothetical protein COO60DRAFT_1701593 [Scenedesmus sp. NREL 46B-D3]|nr:hypothetical protein COO60DRAFT_1701593 [Scenedesmus sp. NREL 46B-D3]
MTGSTGMLAALPAHSLTHLDLQGLHGPVDGPAASAALARLTHLQRLRIDIWRAPYSCLAGVAQLNRLTWLELHGFRSDSEQPLQLLLAQPLPLRVLRLSSFITLPSLDLSRLTQLQEFSYRGSELPDAVFPSQLQQLELYSVGSNKLLQAVMQLQQLRRVTFSCISGASEPLLSRLAQMPALQQLVLVYHSGQQAAAAAVTWPQLPQLRELAVCLLNDGPSRRQWQTIFNGVAASTSLTKLGLEAAFRGDGDGDEDEGADGTWNASCAKLAGLTNLRQLSFTGWSQVLALGDALALTALTRLTRLELYRARAGVGDEAAAALAGSCKQLRHLDLTDCSLVSMACLANVAHLTQLTQLRLERNSGLTQQGLMLLTGLKRLQYLGVERSADVTDEVMEHFWAAMGVQQL